MLVWYDVSIIGYCRVWYGILHMHPWLSVMMLVYGILQWYGMLVWYDVSIIGYCRVWYGILHMHSWFSVMMLVYGILQWYGMSVWYDVSVIGYCRVCYCMLELYDVSIIGYCRVWNGIYYTSMHGIVLWLLVYVIYLVYGMVMMLKSWG